jgi:hypothetical protein
LNSTPGTCHIGIDGRRKIAIVKLNPQMKSSQRKLWVIGLGLLFWNSLLHAQLATTNYNGIRATVMASGRGGAASNLESGVRLELAGALHVVASGINREKAKSTNTYACYMQLTFMGGQVGRASGIRRLSVKLAKGDNGQDFRINEKSLFWWDCDHVAPLGSVGLPGPQVVKWLPLETSSPDVRFIRLLEGEAELFNPSTENGGLLEFNNFTVHPGEALNNHALSRCGVRLSFLGCVNAEAKHKEWSEQRDLLMQGMPSRKVSETNNDSLMFSVEDPKNRIVTMEFFDKSGKWLPAGHMVAWARRSKPVNNLQVYCFQQPPATDGMMRVKLATPESLSRIKFKMENIPLPL